MVHGKLLNVAKLAAISYSVTPMTVRPKLPLSILLDKYEYIKKIFNKVNLLASQFIGLPQREIAKIFVNKFQLINLYKFYYIIGYNNIYQDQISIEEGTIKMRKVTNSYKKYGRDNVL